MIKDVKWQPLVLGGGLAFVIYLLGTLGLVIQPFLLALLGAYILKTPVKKLSDMGIPRAIGSLIVILAAGSLIVLFFLIVIPSLQTRIILLLSKIPQIADNIIMAIRPLLDTAENYIKSGDFESIRSQITNHSSTIMKWALNTALNIFSSTTMLASIIVTLILTPILTFYLLNDWPNMVAHLKTWLPIKRKKSIINEFNKMDNAVVAYAKGQSIVCLALAIMYGIGLVFIGLKSAIIVSLIIGVLAFIPYVGVTIGLLVSIIFALSQGDHISMWSIALVFSVIQAIEGYLLTPRLIGEKIGIPPIMVIFSLLAGGAWFGLVGVLFALPTAAIMKVLLDTVKLWLQKSETIKG